MKSAALILVALLSMKIIGLSIAARSPTPIPPSKSFVGYGGDIMLPFLHGATLRFYAGEELWIMATENVQIRLTSPHGSISYMATATMEPQILKRFGDEDLTGSWLLEQLNPEGVLAMKIELEKYVTNGPIELVFNLEEGNLSATIERKFQSSAAFLSQDGLPAIAPGELVRIKLGTRYLGQINVKVLSMEPEFVEGYSGTSQLRVEVTPLLADYTVGVEGSHVEFWLPNVHEVGPGGLFPLRYGPIAIEVTPKGVVPGSMVRSKFYVFPVKPSVDARLSNRLELEVKEALHTSLEVALSFSDLIVAYGTQYRFAFANSTIVHVSPPVAHVHVFDEMHAKYLIKEEFSLRVGDSQVWYNNNSAYVLYLKRVSITKEYENLTLPFTYELKIGGFTAGEAISEPLTLSPGEFVIIVTRVYELKIRAVDTEGKPVKSHLSVNGTVSVALMGEANLKMPRGHYALEVSSSRGNETRTILLENDMEITFTLGQHGLILTLLMVLGAAEALAIAIFATLLIKTTRTLSRSLPKIPVSSLSGLIELRRVLLRH